jgi:CRISPR-associated DxTHG motif protein
MTLVHFTHGVNFFPFDAKISICLVAALHKMSMI